MASFSPEVNRTKAKELGKYEVIESRDGRPHDKSRVLSAEEVDVIKMCDFCDKHIRKVRDTLVCSCKKAIHCSKECFKSSKHSCEDSYDTKKSASTEITQDMRQERHNDIFNEVVGAGLQRYREDVKNIKGPSSEKYARLMKLTRGEHRRIMKYGETGNAIAAYVIGNAYMEREFDRRKGWFAIPLEYKDKSVAETNEIAVKWLKLAAEGGIPEAMFCLFLVLVRDGGLQSDRRVADYWLDRAYNTGRMNYLINILNVPSGANSPGELDMIYLLATENTILWGEVLGYMLLATRFRELKAWGGKTGMGEPFYGWNSFVQIMEAIGQEKTNQLSCCRKKPSFIFGEKKTVLVVSARLGHSDFIDKLLSYKREENNLKFVQGVKQEFNPDYQLAGQTSNVVGRTNYLVSCKHDQVNMEEEGEVIKLEKIIMGVRMTVKESLEDLSKKCKSAGNCESCVEEANHRLRAVNLGLFSLSLTQVLSPEYYAARYAKEDGVIVQDIFMGYSKPYMRQLLQCLMSNPADLHPLSVAEDANMFWPMIWFWGSVYEAVKDSCDKPTLDAIYRGLGDKIAFSGTKNDSALAAFPEDAAGEWRIACGNEDCPKVDHEVKFNLCKGCRVRRYCDAACQRKDWAKHMQFCKAGKKDVKK